MVPFINIDKWPADVELPLFLQIGVYAYRLAALTAYMSWLAGKLECLEGLDQLRFLENGETLKCFGVEGRGRAFWKLNNHKDVADIEGVIEQGARKK